MADLSILHQIEEGAVESNRYSITGREVRFADDELIVSKTDMRGIMTYVNDVFLSVSGFSEEEMIGKPHSAIRHPHMPRCVFKLLWETIRSGNEIFAYVVNRCKNGDHYWVLAHVTPTLDEKGEFNGYHSNRRVPNAQALAAIKPIYEKLLAEEQRLGGVGRQAVDSSLQMLHKMLADKGVSYDKFILSL